MKVLIVARYKEHGFAPFVTEQVQALEKTGAECRCFPVYSKGVMGYLRQLPKLGHVLREFKPDVIHAHYGLCGLFANLQRRIPVVTTYHGSDINNPKAFEFSKIAIRRSTYNVFVSQKNIDIANPPKNYALIPCGINIEDYPIVEKLEARKRMSLNPDKKYILFAGAFDNKVKNAPLAQEAVNLLHDNNVKLLELKGYTRTQVALLMQAADAFLMTSVSEGSPQVIKEALACCCPIVSVDVGDVKERIEGVDGCYLTQNCNPTEVAECLKKALSFSGKTCGKEKLVADGLDNRQVAERLMGVYKYCHENC